MCGILLYHKMITMDPLLIISWKAMYHTDIQWLSMTMLSTTATVSLVTIATEPQLWVYPHMGFSPAWRKQWCVWQGNRIGHFSSIVLNSHKSTVVLSLPSEKATAAHSATLICFAGMCHLHSLSHYWTE